MTTPVIANPSTTALNSRLAKSAIRPLCTAASMLKFEIVLPSPSKSPVKLVGIAAFAYVPSALAS